MIENLWTLRPDSEQRFERGDRRPSVTELLPELLIGEYPQPADIGWLKERFGVSAVHSLQDERDLVVNGLSLAELTRACREQGIRFVRTPIADGSSDDLARHLGQALGALEALASGRERVYLHCNAGVNRAPTVAIAFIHRRLNLTLEEATNFVKERRNCGPFVSVLEEFFRSGCNRIEAGRSKQSE
jgi:protein-tyrosine phosphatase